MGRYCVWAREWEGLMLGYMGASLEPAVPEVGLGTGSAWAGLHPGSNRCQGPQVWA